MQEFVGMMGKITEIPVDKTGAFAYAVNVK